MSTTATRRRCPTPRKTPYATHRAALWALKNPPDTGPHTSMFAPTRIYQCCCGSYHLSSHWGRRRF